MCYRELNEAHADLQMGERKREQGDQRQGADPTDNWKQMSDLTKHRETSS